MKKKTWYKSKGGWIGAGIGYLIEIGFLFLAQNSVNIGDNYYMNSIFNIITRSLGFFNNTFNIGAVIMTLVFSGIGFFIGRWISKGK